MKKSGRIFNRSKLIFLALACCFFVWLQAQQDQATKHYKVFLVHGTFARGSTWYRPCGDFFKQLELWGKSKKITMDLRPFAWSGKLSAAARVNAAVDLVQELVKESQMLLPQTKTILIGHSHGGNVIFLASQMLALARQNSDKMRAKFNILIEQCFEAEKACSEASREFIYRSLHEETDSNEVDFLQAQDRPLSTAGLEVFKDVAFETLCKNLVTRGDDSENIVMDEVFVLGTPIDIKTYFPSHEVIKRLYSLYSIDDFVQVYSEQFKRRFSDFHDCQSCNKDFIVELRATFTSASDAIDVKDPTHLQLNNKAVGRWILEIPEIVPCFERGRKTFNNFQYGWINFCTNLSRLYAKLS